MRRSKLLWQIYFTFLFITLSALIAVAWYNSFLTRKLYTEQAKASLDARAHVIFSSLTNLEYFLLDTLTFDFLPNPYNFVNNHAAVDRVCKRLGSASGTRITVILQSGKVIGDTYRPAASLENARYKPEVAAALTGKTGMDIRMDGVTGYKMIYYAIPVGENDEIKAVVRTAIKYHPTGEFLQAIYVRLFVLLVVIALLSAILILYISRKISRQITELREGVQRFAKGDFNRLLITPDTEEFVELSHAMNEMAIQLRDRIQTIQQQKDEQGAVFASMMEGVIAIDQSERIIAINDAACNLFGLSPAKLENNSLVQVIRHPELHKFIARLNGDDTGIESELVIHGENEKLIQLHGTHLNDENGERRGIVVVLNDVTRIRQLERTRSDFVANVSHELRTPITSIRGFVETLQGGAIDNPEDRTRFLEIISRQVNHLNELIEDLLQLARIERQEDNKGIELGEALISPVIQGALQACRQAADKKNMKVAIICDETLSGIINEQLLERALINLLDNAIRYSPAKSKIEISARKIDRQLSICIKDQGPGISQENQARIFERFYRVEKARSTQPGGTGLGLAIVKHIAQVHRGSVNVESRIGHGSTFTIVLPNQDN